MKPRTLAAAVALAATLILTACGTDPTATSGSAREVEGIVTGKTHILPGKTSPGCNATGALYQSAPVALPERPGAPAPKPAAPARPAAPAKPAVPAKPAPPAVKPKPLTRHRDGITHRDTYTHANGTTMIYPIIVPYSHCPRVKHETWRLDVQENSGHVVSVDVSPMVYDSCRTGDEYESDDNDCERR